MMSLLAVACLVTGCVAPGGTESGAQAPTEATLDMFSPDRIKADVEFLAHDLLKGRDTGSKGYLIAANYVANQYKQLGLTPMGLDGGFFQPVAFATGKVDAEASSISVTVDGETTQLIAGKHYAFTGSVRVPDAEASGDLVFAGYGIHAPELGYSDIEGLDINGKIVVIIMGAPKELGSEVRAHFRSTASKAAALEKKGAAGVLVLLDKATQKRVSFERISSYRARGQFSWQSPDQSPVSSPLPASAELSSEAAELLFKGAEQSLEDVLNAEAEGTMKSFALKSSATIKKVTILSDEITSPNVVAMIPGTDPNLRDEYVVLSAHLDHVGTNENAKGDDKIFNGAMDNATGTSMLLEVARAYMMNGFKPRRSILLLSVTAEEKGLLGAEYFAHFPTVPASAMVANVNLDMPVLLYDFQDVIAFGAEHSSLAAVTDRAAQKAGIVTTPDPMPEQNLFVRSDHYRFVQQGIPAVFLMTGFLETPDGDVGGDIFKGFLSGNYHSPQDSPDQPIHYGAGAKFAFVNFLIANEIANADERPTWNEGDFFGNAFSKSR